MATAGRELRIEGLTKSFEQTLAVDNLDLVVEPGILLALLGPSGCGKTTTLRAIAGFEAPDSGRIVIGGRDVGRLPPDKRELGMVFQNYSLFPHMTVAENISFGLRMRKTHGDDVGRLVGEMLELVQLPGYEKRFPNQLSGGQQQRVALARSLVTRPSVLLLDEPLGALDKNLRETMQFELRRIQQTLGITTILVTHDQEEALTLSDRVVVMNGGRILQQGTPQYVYERPRTRFVSEFLGTSNLIEGRLGAPVGSNHRSFIVSLESGDVVLSAHDPDGGFPAGKAVLAIRPEKLAFAQDPAAAENGIDAVVSASVFRGSYHAYEVLITGRRNAIIVYDQTSGRSGQKMFNPGDRVRLTWRTEDAVLLEA